MKKTLVFFIFFALLGVITPFAGAHIVQNEAVPEGEIASSTTHEDVIRMIQKDAFLPGQIIEETFTTDELNEFFADELQALKITWFVDKVTLKTSHDSAEIVAHLLRPFKGNLTVRGAVTVEDGMAEVVIDSAKYGFFPVPASFAERIGSFVMKRESPKEWLRLKNARWEEVILRPGTVSVTIAGNSEGEE